MMTGRKKLKFGMVSLDDPSRLQEEIDGYNGLLNSKADLVSRFITMEDDFPRDMCNIIKNCGSTPLYTWLLNDYKENGSDTRTCKPHETGLDEILSGTYDNYFIEFAMAAKKWKHPLKIRMLYEFNTDWYVWSGYKNGAALGGPLMVKETWKYIVDIFRAIGADNVKWVWCPHEPSSNVPLEEWNSIFNYWPGDNYVDYMGIDGFNFFPVNPERENPSFQSFDDLFMDTYNSLLQISDKPIFIMTGTGEYNYTGDIANKPLWISDAINKIKSSYTKVEMFFWFNHKFNKDVDWRINSSSESLKVFRDLIGA